MQLHRKVLCNLHRIVLYTILISLWLSKTLSGVNSVSKASAGASHLP